MKVQRAISPKMPANPRGAPQRQYHRLKRYISPRSRSIRSDWFQAEIDSQVGSGGSGQTGRVLCALEAGFFGRQARAGDQSVGLVLSWAADGWMPMPRSHPIVVGVRARAPCMAGRNCLPPTGSTRPPAAHLLSQAALRRRLPRQTGPEAALRAGGGHCRD